MRGLNAKNLVVFRVNKFYIKNLNFISLFLFLYPSSYTPCILIYLYIKIPLISPCHRSPDKLLPSNQLLTFQKNIT